MMNCICEVFSSMMGGDSRAAWTHYCKAAGMNLQQVDEYVRAAAMTAVKPWLMQQQHFLNRFNNSVNFHMFIIARYQDGFWEEFVEKAGLKEQIYYQSPKHVSNAMHPETGPTLRVFILKGRKMQ